MDIFAIIRGEVIAIIENCAQKGELPEALKIDAVTAEPPRESSHGDISTNAAMVLAKQAKKNPREVAKILVPHLEALAQVSTVEIAGPGFINIRLEKHIWREVVASILTAKETIGQSNIGQGNKVNIEYVSANPTGPMHIGHARGAVYGDALASLLEKAGYDVTREYYINDAGAQIIVLLDSAFLRYKQALGQDVTIPEGLYPGEYLIPVGAMLAETFGDLLLEKEQAEIHQHIRQPVLDAMMQLIKDDLKDLGVIHDVFTSEKDLHESKKVEDSIALLDKKDLVYRGILEPPKGKKPEDWEAREQLLFRSTAFGDDVDRPLQKSDGSWAYFAPDVAYHYDKYQRGFNDMVIVLGADHGGYVKRLKAAVKAVSGEEAEIDVKISQLVNFMENGVPIKMSKRAGTFTTVKDVVEAVGADVVRFIMMTRKNDAVLDFDLVQVQEQSSDNPIFYVQYAHARACSVWRVAATECPAATALCEKDSSQALDALDQEEEFEFIKILAAWPRVVTLAAKSHEPHRVAFYLQELAAAYHSFWNKGKEKEILRFILPEDPGRTAARLALLQAMKYVIASALEIFKIEPKSEM